MVVYLAIALRFALNFARFGLFTLETESDSLVAVQAMKNSPHLSSYFRMAISNCKHLAGYLTTLVTHDTIWVGDIPDCITSYLTFDFRGY